MRRLRLIAIGVIIALSCGALAVYWLWLPTAPPTSQVPQVTIRVVGHQWYWEFFVTDETGQTSHTFGEATVQVGSQVNLIVTSADIVYAFYVPELSLKLDVIPGHENTFSFAGPPVGDYAVKNAEFGEGSYLMVATLHVVPA